MFKKYSLGKEAFSMFRLFKSKFQNLFLFTVIPLSNVIKYAHFDSALLNHITYGLDSDLTIIRKRKIKK